MTIKINVWHTGELYEFVGVYVRDILTAINTNFTQERIGWDKNVPYFLQAIEKNGYFNNFFVWTLI